LTQAYALPVKSASQMPLAPGRAGPGKPLGFFADGVYHNLVILKRRPQRTRRGIFWALTSLPFLDYAIAINLYPENIRQEISKAEKSLRRVPGDYLARSASIRFSPVHAVCMHSLLQNSAIFCNFSRI
jgi:hypothetical protein